LLKPFIDLLSRPELAGTQVIAADVPACGGSDLRRLGSAETSSCTFNRKRHSVSRGNRTGEALLFNYPKLFDYRVLIRLIREDDLATQVG
jgi:hypothetical protein